MSSKNLSMNTSASELKCLVCETDLTLDVEWMKTKCNHLFHRECAVGWVNASHNCPSCKKLCHIRDLKSLSNKLKKNFIKQFKNKKQINYNDTSVCIEHDNSDDEIIEISDTMQPDKTNIKDDSRQLHSTMKDSNPNSTEKIDYNIIKQMIEQSFKQMFTDMTIKNQETSQTPENIQQETSFTRPSNNQTNPNFSTRDSYRSNSYLSPEKITTIIQNWHLKFDGSSNGMRCEEFIYRVKALTHESLQDNYLALCNNLHILLSGKAKEFYWRYHKQVQVIEWKAFCAALRYQYQEHKSDSDIREEISQCKQKPGESFESYFDAINSIADKLTIAMTETELIERTVRNLRPDIRHELLYVPIHSIAQLRKLCQMRENFFKEETMKRNFVNRNVSNFSPHKNVSTVDFDVKEESEMFVEAIRPDFNSKIVCHNCDEIGHKWDMCLRERKIFCYGCGAKNVYKPQCQICLAKTSENFRRDPFNNSRM